MPENAWFYGNPGSNAYDVSEHVRRSLWFTGYRQAWFDCTRAESPYSGMVRWREQEFPIEWESGRYLVAWLEREDKEIVRGFSTILGIKPLLQYQDADGRTAVEWRRTGQAARAEELAAMPGVKDVKRLR
jgi:hypothetical protein